MVLRCVNLPAMHVLPKHIYYVLRLSLNLFLLSSGKTFTSFLCIFSLLPCLPHWLIWDGGRVSPNFYALHFCQVLHWTRAVLLIDRVLDSLHWVTYALKFWQNIHFWRLSPCPNITCPTMQSFHGNKTFFLSFIRIISLFHSICYFHGNKTFFLPHFLDFTDLIASFSCYKQGKVLTSFGSSYIVCTCCAIWLKV